MKDVFRYSESFKRQVVREIENGVHPNCFSAAKAYGIRGACTVPGWVSKYGKTHLQRRVIRVETTEERNEVKMLRKRVRDLEAALGDAHLDLRLERAYLEIACESAGIGDIGAFKKKQKWSCPMRGREAAGEKPGDQRFVQEGRHEQAEPLCQA